MGIGSWEKSGLVERQNSKYGSDTKQMLDETNFN